MRARAKAMAADHHISVGTTILVNTWLESGQLLGVGNVAMGFIHASDSSPAEVTWRWRKVHFERGGWRGFTFRKLPSLSYHVLS